jgi:peptidoglycan/LPS O-acetylase OafA/YrhL
MKFTPRYESLDHWRGLAALSVVLCHCVLHSPYATSADRPTEGAASWAVAFLAHGWVGVPLFFTVSGYCVCAAADRSRGRVGTYFLRRLRRIYPPYWACLTLCLALWPAFGHLWEAPPGGRFPDPIGLSAWQWAGNWTLTELWRPRLVGEPASLFLTQAWSLVYEEQYYLVVGLCLLCGRLFAGIALVTAVVLGLWLAGLAPERTFLDPYWLAFAAGALAYWSLVRAGRRGRLLAAMALTASAAVLLWRYGHVLRLLHSVPEFGAAVGVAFALTLVLLRPLDARLAGSRLLRPLGWVGVRCYSVYLIHWPVVKGVTAATFLAGVRTDAGILLLTVPVGTALSLLAGWWFHRAVERRFLNTRPTPNPEVSESSGDGP